MLTKSQPQNTSYFDDYESTEEEDKREASEDWEESPTPQRNGSKREYNTRSLKRSIEDLSSMPSIGRNKRAKGRKYPRA
jgi:hypothetical protein